MGEAGVFFDGVWKKFRRGERHDSLRDLVPAMVKGLLGRTPADALQQEEFWAVEDVSFEVKPGEALGIIGPNGAGKSTTLKLLTRILRPNRGSCRVVGRVGALIEIAAGFHPDLTGRENVFLQGAIMGMKRTEVARKLDQIVEFAGVGEFIDTQIKRYSSGMNARLGFAIAAHLDPDVLIIDEVLSVGDAAFQQRCVERMFDFKREGAAIVFVSHNLQAVADLCDRALFLRRQCRFLGPTAEAISCYVRSISTSRAESNLPVTLRATLHERTSGETRDVITPGTRMVLRVVLQPKADYGPTLLALIAKRTTDELLVYDGQFMSDELGLSGLTAGRETTVEFEFSTHLTRGQYHLSVHVVDLRNQKSIGWLAPAGLLTVDERRTWGGVSDLAVVARLLQPTR